MSPERVLREFLEIFGLEPQAFFEAAAATVAAAIYVWLIFGDSKPSPKPPDGYV